VSLLYPTTQSPVVVLSTLDVVDIVIVSKFVNVIEFQTSFISDWYITLLWHPGVVFTDCELPVTVLLIAIVLPLLVNTVPVVSIDVPLNGPE